MLFSNLWYYNIDLMCERILNPTGLWQVMTVPNKSYHQQITSMIIDFFRNSIKRINPHLAPTSLTMYRDLTSAVCKRARSNGNISIVCTTMNRTGYESECTVISQILRPHKKGLQIVNP